MKKTYAELDHIVLHSRLYLGTDEDHILQGIRALKAKVCMLEKELLEFRPVVPSEMPADPEGTEDEQAEDVPYGPLA